MPRNGSGGYTLPPGVNPVVTQTIITSNWANTTLEDVAFALANSIAKDGQTLPIANLPMGGFRHTGAGDPASRQDYSTLGFVQDGRHFRLTNVQGNNTIKANLPGGGLTLSVGQLVQLVPIASNSVALVTLSINGGSTHTVLSPGGNTIPVGGLQAGKVYLLSYDGTDWNMVNAPGQASFAQSAMSGWDRPGVVAPYPDMGIVNPTTISVPAGAGRIIAPGSTDLAGVTEVSWPSQNVGITNLATSWATTIAIDINGDVVQFVGNVQSSWARNHIILGVVGHVDGAVTNVLTRPTIFGDMIYAAYDLGTLFHNLLIAGGRMQPNGGNPLHIDIEEGSVWLLGGTPDAVDSPNIYSFPTQLDIQFFPIRADNVVGAQTGLVPTTVYQPGGVGAPIAIPGAVTTATIGRLYILANQFLFLYGQQIYTDLETALSQILADDSQLVSPTKLVDATFVGYLVYQKNTAGFNNPATARLVSSGNATFNIGSAGSIPDAPLDGSTYGRNNAAWVKTVDTIQPGTNVTVNAANANKPIVNVPSSNLVAGEGINFSGSAGTDRLLGAGNLTITGTEAFRNKIINGRFDFWQRAVTFGPTTGFGYVADMFAAEGQLDTRTLSRQAFTLGQVDVPGNPQYFHRYVGVSAGGSNLVSTYIEDVTQFSGQPVTLTWYAKADANRQMSIEFTQRFGAGGSTQVFALGVVKVNLTTSWQKFTHTFTSPSIAGKALGTTPSCLKVSFWYSADASLDARTNSLGLQSGTFDLAMVQLEIGAVSTAFEQRPKGVELALCQRYFEKSYNLDVFPAAISNPGRAEYSVLGIVATTLIFSTPFKVTKAVTPAITVYSPFTGAAGMVSPSDNSDLPATTPIVGTSSFTTSWALGGKSGGKFQWIAIATVDGT